MTRRLELVALPGLPMVEPGDDLAGLISEGLERAGTGLKAGDILVVAQKVVSKAEGRYAFPAGTTPSSAAKRLAALTHKDPAHIEILLGETAEVVRHRPGVVVVEHRRGYVMANAGIDHSNIEAGRLLLLPCDPDASARALRTALADRWGVAPGIIVSDSFGRAWRVGTCGVAIGVAGLPAIDDRRGAADLFGQPLEVTIVGQADEIAAAASILQGQANEATPAVLVRGLDLPEDDRGVEPLLRDRATDLFR
ncbi:MAG: coenzyme F420-0:L-glutamate ligase [Alphaproteobacteria bacterium]|nr:coenzyme F420-0:L-glutamate ligase [Alphaproteobacteria bacterium]MCY4319668.1 coenzyme F420-0:L-glutamate ligase [Alphaproteobacteria bacterium]